MPQTFGATVAGVLDFVPELRLDADDPDVIATVTTFLDVVDPMATAVLSPRLRALIDLEAAGIAEAALVVVEANAAAAGVVQLGAASLTQDSRYPELAASERTNQAWGATLWARFEAALEQLAGSLDVELERLGADTVVDTLAADVPAVSAPPPTLRDHTRW